MSESLYKGLLKLARGNPDARPFVAQIVRHAQSAQQRVDRQQDWLRGAFLRLAEEERRVTPESEAWARDVRGREEHLRAAARAFVPIFKRLREIGRPIARQIPGDSKSEKTRRRNTMKAEMARDSYLKGAVQTFLDDFIGTVKMDSSLAKVRNDALNSFAHVGLSLVPLKKSWAPVKDKVLTGYQVIEMAASQRGLRKEIPKDIRRFLPTNLVVEVDEGGAISQVTDRFVNEYETIAVKRGRQKEIVKRYNDIVAAIKKDMRGPDPKNRLAAIITSIVMETGIRPGQAKNKATVKIDGEKVQIATFGATSLKIKHLKDIRDNFISLDFIGKMGSRNLAHISNRDLLKALKSLIKKAVKDLRSGASPENQSLFTLPDGSKFSYGMLYGYFKRTAALSGLKVTDFRKLKATETVLQNLHDAQEELHARIRDFVGDEVEDLKKRVAQEISQTVERAYLNAQTALSHENVDTTIRAYVNPEVLLRFLSRGGIEDNLERVILSGKDKLTFNVEKFIENAMKGGIPRTASFIRVSHMLIASQRFTSLGDLLNKIEDDIDEGVLTKVAAGLGDLLNDLEESIEEDEGNLKVLS